VERVTSLDYGNMSNPSRIWPVAEWIGAILECSERVFGSEQHTKSCHPIKAVAKRKHTQVARFGDAGKHPKMDAVIRKSYLCELTVVVLSYPIARGGLIFRPPL